MSINLQEKKLVPLSELLKQYPEANFLTRILGSGEKLKDQVLPRNELKIKRR